MVLLGAMSALLIVAMLGAVVALFIVGTINAVRARRRSAGRPRRRPRPAIWPGPGAEAALRRHPAGRGRGAMVWGEESGPMTPPWSAPIGPDDDPEFIDALDRLIRGKDDGDYPS
jgi:hypothetical protein